VSDIVVYRQVSNFSATSWREQVAIEPVLADRNNGPYR